MSFPCAVCYETCSAEDEAIMPCCHNPTSSLHYCKLCITIICQHPPGRCPTCRSYIQYNTAQGIVSVTERRDPCKICRQTRVIVNEQQGICEACLLGLRYRFQYECDSCHRVQRIAHPMWKYQRTPTVFGTETWSCQLGCNRQTHWKIIATQAGLVPAEHCPLTWGRRDVWLAEVRRESKRKNKERRNRVFYFRATLLLWLVTVLVMFGLEWMKVEVVTNEVIETWLYSGGILILGACCYAF